MPQDFHQTEKIVMSFAKDGNSDIYTMDLDSRVVERITDHSSIDTSPLSHQMENLLHSIQIEVVYSKFMLCEVTEQMLKELLSEMEFMELPFGHLGRSHRIYKNA